MDTQDPLRTLSLKDEELATAILATVAGHLQQNPGGVLTEESAKAMTNQIEAIVRGAVSTGYPLSPALPVGNPGGQPVFRFFPLVLETLVNNFCLDVSQIQFSAPLDVPLILELYLKGILALHEVTNSIGRTEGTNRIWSPSHGLVRNLLSTYPHLKDSCGPQGLN